MAKVIIRILALASLLVLAVGCSDSSNKVPKVADVRELLRSQILANSDVRAVTGPFAASSNWAVPTGWQSFNCQATALVVLIQIDENLIDLAVRQWAAVYQIKDQNRVDAAKQDVERRFLRYLSRTFLLLASPATGCSGHWWGYSFRDLPRNISLISFAGKEGSVSDIESCAYDQLITAGSQPFSCIIRLRDPTSDTDPRYRVRLSGIRFSIQKYDATRDWIASSHSMLADFQFETGDVPLVALVSRNVPWPELHAAHIGPKERTIEAALGKGAVEFVTELALKVLSAAVLKGIGIK